MKTAQSGKTKNEMGKEKDVFLLSLFVFLFSAFKPFPAVAAFEDLGTGARAASLANAYTALGDDVPSLMYNPASLARIDQPEIASEYSRFFTGLTDQSDLGQFFMGYGQPLKLGGTVAFGWKQFSLDNLYAERTLSLGYGRWITQRWAAGLAVKQLHLSYGVPNIVVDDAGDVQSGTPALFLQNGSAESAFSADLGTLYRITDRYMLGASVQNINQPNMALSSSDDDQVPRTLRTGIAYQGIHGLAADTDLAIVKNTCCQQDVQSLTGIEKWWSVPVYGDWAARGGVGLGSREFRQFSMGFGYRFKTFQIDYAFVFDTSGIAIGDTAGTHRFSLDYRFGASEKLKASEILVLTSTPTAKTAPEPALTAGVTTQAQAPALPMPIRPAPPALSASSVTIRTELEFLTHLNRTLSSYQALAQQDAPISDQVASLEPVFDDLHVFYQNVRKEWPELSLLADLDPMADSLKYFNVIRPFGSSDAERREYIVFMLEKYVEPYIRIRRWNSQDARDTRYQAWLGEAWDHEHALVRSNAGAKSRLDDLLTIVRKAIRFEHQAPEVL